MIHTSSQRLGVVHSIVVTGSNRAQETPWGRSRSLPPYWRMIRATLVAIANIGVWLLGKLFFRELLHGAEF
ncbi:MAG: hypothetical protein U0703_25240 [Anaerolineae bacterium]